MSNYRGHIKGSLSFALVYMITIAIVFAVDLHPDGRAIFNGYLFPVSLLGLSVIFGLWPDVDTNSKAQNWFYAVLFGLDIVLISYEEFRAAAYVGLIAMLPILGKHRGWTHNPLAIVIIPLPLLILPFLYNETLPWSGLPYYGAAVVGYFSHLWFDSLIWPRKRRYKRKR